ncbi:hypothetical protein CYFUS_004017 [Cystobacter fuscus]|uniref:Uncharacterized protein n=1 Tax=Cystobacter fuscus TaxID=43 RepID=A0A250J506_9BACT|nr:hypothetical protein CYFUS_004017 [Cystobacter fuscus]
MANEYRSPGAGEGGGTQLEARREVTRGPSQGAPAGAFGLILFFLNAACATQAPMGGQVAEERRWRPSSAKEARAAPRQLEPMVVVFADSPLARGNTCVVALTAAEYQRAVQMLGHRFQVRIPAKWNTRSGHEKQSERQRRWVRFTSPPSWPPGQIPIRAAHRVARELEAVSVVHQPVENGVGQGGVANHRVPVLGFELARHHGGADAVAVLEHLQQLLALAGAQRLQAEFVQNQHLGLCAATAGGCRRREPAPARRRDARPGGTPRRSRRGRPSARARTGSSRRRARSRAGAAAPCPRASLPPPRGGAGGWRPRTCSCRRGGAVPAHRPSPRAAARGAQPGG